MRRPKRVLAVDDQPANLVLLKKILEPAGFEVSEARSGAEALAVAQETTPDLILLDMHLPDMHGLDVLRRMRLTTWGAGLRVAAMSALATPEDRTHWVQAGCLGTVEKPITVKTLVQEISQWLPGAGRLRLGLGEVPRPGAQPAAGVIGDITQCMLEIHATSWLTTMLTPGVAGTRAPKVA